MASLSVVDRLGDQERDVKGEGVISADLRPFLPSLLIERPEFSAPAEGEGVVLFIDVAGFTTLSEALGARGAEGAEHLDRAIARYFDGLLARLIPFGGIPLKVSGDAMTVLFHRESESLPSMARRAISCARGLHALGKGQDVVQTPGGLVSLGHKVGIGSGSFICGVIGQGAEKEFVFAGEALDRSVKAEKAASAGVICVSPELEALVEQPSWWADAPRDGMLVLLPGQEGSGEVAALEVSEEAITPPMELVPWVVREAIERGTLPYLSRHQTLTVLFVAFEGLTFDTPDSLLKLERHYQAMQEVVLTYGGHLSEFEAGDKGSKFIILFGAPKILEDAPGFAIRCAANMQAVAKKMGVVTSQRIGISTGKLYVGRIGCWGIAKYSALGDRMNVAARLMSASEPWSILAEEVTIARAGRHGIWSDVRPLEVRGKKEPLRVATLTEVRAWEDVERRGRNLIGRKVHKLAGGSFLRVLKERSGGVLMLRGPTGIGKTALLDFIEREAKAMGIKTIGWSDGTLRQNVRPMSAWRGVVRDLAGIPPQSSKDGTEAFFQAWLKSLPGALAREGSRLAPILELDHLDDPILQGVPEAQRMRLRGQALADCLLANNGTPRLLILDGADALDEPSFTSLLALAQELRLLSLGVVIACRGVGSHWDDRFAKLEALPSYLALPLHPLGDDEVLELAERSLGASFIEAELEDLIIERAEGNPSRVESWVSLLMSMGKVEIQDGEAFLRGSLDSESLPDRLESIALARLGTLPPEVRLTIGVASVIGLSFTPAEVASLHPEGVSLEQIEVHLRSGVGGAIIYVHRGAPERFYFVRQEVFEAIHDSLPFQVKRALHRRRADSLIEAGGGDISGEAVLIIARHYEFIEDPAEQARWFARAAETSESNYDYRTLLRWTEKELKTRSLLEEDDALIRAIERYQEALGYLGEAEARLLQLELLCEIAVRVGNTTAEVHSLIARARVKLRLGDTDLAIDEFRRALARARESGYVGLRVEAYSSIAGAYAESGQHALALESVEEALALGLTEDQTLLAQLLFAKGNALSGLRRPREAYESFREAEPYFQGANIHMEARLEGNLGIELFSLGHLEEGLGRLRRALSLRRRLGERREEAIGLMNIGYAAYVSGELQEAKDACRDAIRLCRRLNFVQGELVSLGNLGECFWAEGNLGRAGELFQANEALLSKGPGQDMSMGELWLRQGELALTGGEVEEAETLFRKARTLAIEGGALVLKLNASEGLALTLWRKGDGSGAKAMIAEIHGLMSGAAEGLLFPHRLHFRVGCILDGLGDEEGALAEHKRAQQLLIERLAQFSKGGAREKFLSAFPWNRGIHARLPFDINAVESRT